jgi:hypothetical protein
VSPPTSSVVITGNSTTYNGTSWNNGEPDLTKIAVFDGDYISSSNLSACGVIVNAGKTVTFTNSNVLTVKNEVTVNGSLIFENNTSLVQINNVTNSGNIIYNRTATSLDGTGIRGYDYVYWSLPHQVSNIFGIRWRQILIQQLPQLQETGKQLQAQCFQLLDILLEVLVLLKCHLRIFRLLSQECLTMV